MEAITLMHILVIVLSIIVITLSIILTHLYKWMKVIHQVDVYAVSNADESNNRMKLLYVREQTINQLLVNLLYDLLHTTTKASIRWKFHILRQIEPILYNTDLHREHDDIYDHIIKKLSEAGKDGRSDLYERIAAVTRDYFISDTEEAKPLMGLLRNIIADSDRADISQEKLDQMSKLCKESILSFGRNFEVLDSSPYEIKKKDTEAHADIGPLTVDQMLRRMVAFAESIPAPELGSTEDTNGEEESK